MNDIPRRVWVAAIIMSIGWLTTSWVRSGYTFEVQPLTNGLDSLPADLNGYHSSDAPLDEEIKRILNADATLNRTYVRSDGASVVVHASAWLRPEKIASVAPHNPKLCYTNAGWKILEERNVEVETPKGNLPLCALLFERGRERCVVCYWYQMGDSRFNTAAEARRLHREYWGKNRWPATIKFMLQVQGQQIDNALPQIEEFAKSIHMWAIGL